MAVVSRPVFPSIGNVIQLVSQGLSSMLLTSNGLYERYSR
jgi:hypothetical protein